MPTTTFKVSGLTCGHCVASVTEELQEISSVSSVKIDLVAGGESTVSVESSEDLNSQDIVAAVKEAGENYQVTEGIQQ